MDNQTHYDYEDGTVATRVLRPFMVAGRKFNWKDGCIPGIGLDKGAVDKALKKQSVLKITLVEPTKKIYYISPQKIISFMTKNECEGLNGGREIVYFPWKLLEPHEVGKVV